MDLNEYSKLCHKLAIEKGFWDADDSIPVKLMLIVTEISEACEADRYGDNEHFKEEIADIFIRLFDLCGYLNIDIESEIAKKYNRNIDRPKLHGKKY